MGKEKIKIRYIIFVLITMGVIFFGKITRLDNLNAENGRDKGAIISMETYQYNIIFCGENITVNRPKYVMDKSIDFELDQFLKNIINKAPLRWMPPG